ncbi:MAG: hypothetical protein KJ566_03585 [Nanoarchaeota archaeon]|nr:hypothetical protein [Nanoarchaeota archaeon]
MYNLNFEEIIKKMLLEVVEKTIIEGGHYLITKEKEKIIQELNKESTFTFKLACSLVKESRKIGKKVSLSFLVEDLSISPDKRQEFNKNFKLPKEYMDILKENSISEKEIIFFYESRLRNRADNKIKKAVKKKKVLLRNNAFKLNPEIFGSMEILSNISCENKKPVPNCRMLLAQELQDKEIMGFAKSINFCNSNVYKCKRKYTKVYQTLLEGKMDVVNIFLVDDFGEKKIEIYKT